MNKIKAALAPVLLKMGFTQDAVDKMFPETDGVDPVIVENDFLRQAQEYAKPLLKGHFEAELKTHFLGLHMERFSKEIAAASGGILAPADVAGKKPDEIMAMYVAKSKELSGLKETEKDTLITNLNTQLAAKETEFATKLQAATTEFEGKENNRNVLTNLMKKLGDKKMTVTPQVAAEKFMRDLQDKYTLKAKGDGIEFFDKADPTKQLKNASDLNFLAADDVIDPLIKDYNWNANSNGGQGAGSGGDGSGTALTGLPKKADGTVNKDSVSPLVQAAMNAGQIPVKA